MADHLSLPMRSLLSKATEAWENLPAGVGCTNLTLEALETRGLIETRFQSTWQWRQYPKEQPHG